MNTKTLLFMMVFGMALAMIGCNNPKGGKAITVNSITGDTTDVDTTIYGTCGEGTAMHTLELLCDDGKTRVFMFNPDDSISPVYGGMLVGDRMAVIANVEYGDTIASKVINLTTLLGEWTSIDKQFEIKEGGVVDSHVETETNPWTSWKIHNGRLLFNKDTFDIVELGADSMYIENNNGVFVDKRK